jgi:anti-sigma factor RsiW
MAEIDPIEEKALPYLLDELSETEAREFERRMEGSAELAERVRELEEGAAAVALVCPPKRLPKQNWNSIERHIQTERRVIVWWEWFRGKGWAAAAACLVGWFYMRFSQRDRAQSNRVLAQAG